MLKTPAGSALVKRLQPPFHASCPLVGMHTAQLGCIADYSEVNQPAQWTRSVQEDGLKGSASSTIRGKPAVD